jgi:hypothetical protein
VAELTRAVLAPHHVRHLRAADHPQDGRRQRCRVYPRELDRPVDGGRRAIHRSGHAGTSKENHVRDPATAPDDVCPPAGGPDLRVRQRLLDMLTLGRRMPVTLVVPAAGSGKTQLLANWFDSSGVAGTDGMGGVPPDRPQHSELA